MGLEPEKIDQIIEAHSETVNGLKSDIADLKDQVEKNKETANDLKEANKKIGELQDQIDADAKEREGKDYDKLKQEFDDYKAEQERKEVHSKKESAFIAILKDAGVPERHFAKITKYSDIDGLELDDKGKITTAKDVLKNIKEEWADHIEKEDKKGAETAKPPAGNGEKSMTKEEIMKISDRAERQKAIAEHRDLFVAE
jgi:hypothetical protein